MASRAMLQNSVTRWRWRLYRALVCLRVLLIFSKGYLHVRIYMHIHKQKCSPYLHVLEEYCKNDKMSPLHYSITARRILPVSRSRGEGYLWQRFRVREEQIPLMIQSIIAFCTLFFFFPRTVVLIFCYECFFSTYIVHLQLPSMGIRRRRPRRASCS